MKTVQQYYEESASILVAIERMENDIARGNASTEVREHIRKAQESVDSAMCRFIFGER